MAPSLWIWLYCYGLIAMDPCLLIHRYIFNDTAPRLFLYGYYLMIMVMAIWCYCATIIPWHHGTMAMAPWSWLCHHIYGTMVMIPCLWHPGYDTMAMTPPIWNPGSGTVIVAPWLWYKYHDHDTMAITPRPWQWHHGHCTMVMTSWLWLWHHE